MSKPGVLAVRHAKSHKDRRRELDPRRIPKLATSTRAQGGRYQVKK